MFKKNLFYNYLNQIISLLFPLFIQYYLVRTFSLEKIGFINIMLSLQAIVMTFSGIFNIYLLKIFSKNRPYDTIKRIFTNTLILLFTISCLSYLIYITYGFYTFRGNLHIIVLSGITIVSSSFTSEFYFQGKLRNNIIFFRKLISRTIFIILLLLLVKDDHSLFVYFLILTITTSLEHFFNFYYIRKLFDFSLFSKKFIIKIFKNSITYAPFTLTYGVLPHYSIVFASRFYSLYEIGIYSIFIKIINLTTTIVTSSIMVLFPMRVNNSDSEKKSNKTLLYLKYTITASLVLLILLNSSFNIINKLFLNININNNTRIVFAILSLYILIHSIYNYYVFQFYIINNKVFFVTKLNLLILLVFYSLLYHISHNSQLTFPIIFIFSITIPLLILVYKIKELDL